MSRDAVESEPAYQYVRGNVVNRVDPSGMQPPTCSGNPTQICYDPPIGPGNDGLPPAPPLSTPPPTPYRPDTIGPINSCSYSPQYFFDAPGYVEGIIYSASFAFHTLAVNGDEVVYDFATLERGTYKFEGEPLFGEEAPVGITTAIAEGAYMLYDVQLKGFHSQSDLDSQYAGRFIGITFGAGLTPIVTGGFGKIIVNPGSPVTVDSDLYGMGDYTVSSVGVGLDELGNFSASIGATDYKRTDDIHRYVPHGMNVSERHIRQMKNDIMSGLDSPWQPIWTNYTRIKAVNELEETWQRHRYYFTQEYANYQRFSYKGE